MAEKARIGVLISGRGSNMAALLYASKCPDCSFEIALVASNNPDAEGLRLAGAEGIPTFAHPHKGMKRQEFDAIIDGALRKADVQYVALAGYMRLLSSEFVAGWENRMLNIHPSLLPKYKGLHTHERALEAGDNVAGCSVHVVTAELDDGPVLGQTEVTIMPGDTPDSLAARVLVAEHQLYSRTLNRFVRRDMTPDGLLEKLRGLARALPATAERPSHGTPGFHIEGGKFFAYFSHDHHGEGTAVLVKTTGAEEQAMLIQAEPDLYFRPRYLGPSGWVGIRMKGSDTDWERIENRLAQSWRMVAPKRLADLF